MPTRIGPVTRMETLSREERLLEPDFCQAHWYKFVAEKCYGLSVLDVGAGTGYGLDILQAAGAGPVCGIDPAPLRPYILPVPIREVTTASYDAVLAVDVIEHVEDDAAFFEDLLRVARKLVFLSTPNWTISQCVNRFHYREYTPEELSELLHRQKYPYALYTSDACGIVSSITDLAAAANSFGVLIRKN